MRHETIVADPKMHGKPGRGGAAAPAPRRPSNSLPSGTSPPTKPGGGHIEIATHPAKHCTIEFADFETRSGAATGFHPAQEAVANVRPPPNGLANMSVMVRCGDFRIEATRCLINDVVGTLEQLGNAIGRATGADLPRAIDQAVDALQPLLVGRKLTYAKTWDYTLTLATSEKDAYFEVRHRVGFKGGVVTPQAGAGPVGYGVTSSLLAGGEEIKLEHPLDRGPSAIRNMPSGARGDDVYIPDPPMVTLPPGFYPFSETVMIEMEIENFGLEVENLKTRITEAWTWLRQGFDMFGDADQDFGDFLESLGTAAEDFFKGQIETLKDLVRKTTCEVEFNTSIVDVRCVMPEKPIGD